MSRARALAGNGLDGRRVATGSHALVVGGSSGIGLSTAELCKREGADVTAR